MQPNAGPLSTSQRVLLPKKETGSSPSTALSQLSEGGPSKKRKCISLACLQCRTRKSKCDGKKPTCAACLDVYSTECVYDIDSDRRRKGALKRDIKNLMEDNERRDVILDALKKASDADVDDIVQLIRSDKTYEAIADSLENLKLNLISRKSSERPTLEGELADFLGKPCADTTGQTRHYGHTSNLAMLGSVEDLNPRTMVQTASWTTVTTDVEFMKHLFNLYFTWSHPFYYVFSQETFFLGMRDRNIKYCSPLLVNSVLAVACHFSDRREARADPDDPSTAGGHFYEEARRLLCEQILSGYEPSPLTTIQALGVLSIGAAMAGYDSPGWRFAGQTMNMAVELGLHTSLNTSPTATLSPTEIEARNITFWGSYNLFTTWAICIGRISSLPHGAITAEKPIVKEAVDQKSWIPYGDPLQPQIAQRGHADSVLLHCSLLAEIVNDSVHMFYAPQGRTTSRKLLNLYARYQKWEEQLPESLRIQPDGQSTAGPVLTMHIYYHNCVLHLFRPFLRVTFVQVAKPPLVVCMEEARALSDLIALHKRYYGLRRVCLILTHCTMTCAIQHLVNLQSPRQDIAEVAAIDLGNAVRALHEMGSSSTMSKRFLNILMGLIRRWAVTVPENVRQAMADAEVTCPTSAISPTVSMRQPSSQRGDAISPSTTNPPTPVSFPPISSLAAAVSAPAMSQPLTHNTQPPSNQNPFWTPFPGTPEGLPIAHSVAATFPSQQHMDISSMLDSGVAGDWAQLNRDGFTLANTGVGMDPALWRWHGQ
ncbi:fungal specific transcription factor [Phlyctema vagabunda]|uniref:Fungal specific transcription factor n=1 Tax=Phlyctema vagabunda TaxID=108571 RepID=A0ABR4PBA5_9HELO